MNPDIERLAKEAGWNRFDVLASNLHGYDKRFARFAALIAEECCKTRRERSGFDERDAGFDDGQEAMADAIRSKFPMPKEGA